jgi:hypothetical protein
LNNDLLKRLYENIVNTINDKELTIRSDSIFLTYIDKKQQKLIDILGPSCISLETLTQNEINSIDKDLIYKFPNNKISLSAIGIYEYEKSQDFIDDNKIVQFFNNKWKLKVPQSISDTRLNIKEKLVLTSLLASKAFSINQCINTKDESRLDDWYSLFKEVNDFLLTKNFIKASFEDISSPNKGNEKLIHQMMRTIDHLPKKTNTIVISNAEKNYHYYLDIIDKDGACNKEKLKYIIELLTENDADHIQDLRDLCNDIYSKYFSRIYENTLFANYNYQNIIIDISKELLLS